MPSAHQLHPDLCNLRSHALLHRQASDLKQAFSGGATAVRESKEVERFWFLLSPAFARTGRKSTKVDQPRFLRIEGQPKFVQSLLQPAAASWRKACKLSTSSVGVMWCSSAVKRSVFCTALVPTGCYTYALKPHRRAFIPARGPVRGGLADVSLGYAPSLHHLRRVIPFVRRLLWYYGP